jgi:hypothetical protein
MEVRLYSIDQSKLPDELKKELEKFYDFMTKPFFGCQEQLILPVTANMYLKNICKYKFKKKVMFFGIYKILNKLKDGIKKNIK